MHKLNRTSHGPRRCKDIWTRKQRSTKIMAAGKWTHLGISGRSMCEPSTLRVHTEDQKSKLSPSAQRPVSALVTSPSLRATLAVMCSGWLQIKKSVSSHTYHRTSTCTICTTLGMVSSEPGALIWTTKYYGQMGRKGFRTPTWWEPPRDDVSLGVIAMTWTIARWENQGDATLVVVLGIHVGNAHIEPTTPHDVDIEGNIP